MKKHDRDSIIKLLRKHDINPTHQRIEIASVLFSGRDHLSADRIMAAVNREHPETSKATVYNTLNLFLEKGLVREVIVDPGKVFYDAHTEEHYHFYDTAAGRLIDIDPAEITLSGLPPLPSGMVTEGVDIVIRIRPQ